MAAQAYQKWLANPSTDALASDASIAYLPTITTISGAPTVILKHLGAQAQQVKKKENVLNIINGGNNLCVEVETTLQFLIGGGTYLPGLDDNFLADRTVTIPVVHIVAFDGAQKIQQIRMLWDQGSLLKSVEVIGSRGKNWPVHDGKDQVKIITDGATANLNGAMAGASINDRQPRRKSRGGANADKYNTLNLFAPRTYDREESPANPVAPRASARPGQRDYHDLFAAGADLPRERSASPTKGGNGLKAGAGKNFQENRLFDNTPIDLTGPGSPEKISVKTNPKKYNHFEFGDEPIKSQAQQVNKQTKHGSQWNFEDFVTPEKPRQKHLPHTSRQFGWSDDEEEARQPAKHLEYKPKPRPDAAAHFEFNDDATPKADQRPRSSRAAERMGLYEDHVNANDDPASNSSAAGAGPAASEKMPLGNITNVNTKGHQKNFSSQFEMTDDSPSGYQKAKNENANTKKVAKGMQANWQMYDESPEQIKVRGINIQGDGMGSRKKPGEKSWWEYE